ncbi:MFS family permease [Sporomusaceae bacterium BoRhaA]|uniref:MFS transporter n=1 Tax=Pelorhabdus rhamnosifermentans TaxID=2772457 RepID=UPI001C060660|nr:MFS transporter [Pelorhabdus rhamnosifermentans]MBU2702296.1 MFS family permease [Pelorhabdus rhamnosifermentans]
MFKISLLSISLLTIMAGAAVAPGLGEIAQAFPGESQTMIKLILSVPPLFIVPFSILSGILSSRISKKKLLLAGLVVYIIGGFGAAFTDSLIPLLVFRAVLGAGTGIILPLSTGLIADFYQGGERMKMLGYSFSANNLGAIIGNLGAGMLALINWHYVFYVYLIAILVLVLVALFIKGIPSPEKQAEAHNKTALPGPVYGWAFAAFLFMLAFYAIVTNLSLLIYSRNIGDSSFAGILFAINAVSMFAGGFSLKAASQYLNRLLPCCMLLMMAVGYSGLGVCYSQTILILSIIIAGFGSGWAYPFIINKASAYAPMGKNIAVMAVVSSAAFLGQFASPLILDTLHNVSGGTVTTIFFTLAGCMGLLAVISLSGTFSKSLPNQREEQ